MQGRLDALHHPAAASPTRQSYGYDAGSRLNRYDLLLRADVGGRIEQITLGCDARDKLLESARREPPTAGTGTTILARASSRRKTRSGWRVG